MSERRKAYRVSAPALPRIDEHSEQRNFISEVAFRYQQRDDFVDVLLFAPPNGAWFGGSNPWALYNKFKAEGFKKGVSDLLYLQPRGEYSCLAIEMKANDRKADKDGGVSPEQAEFLAAINASGGTGEVCYGCEEAVRVFDWYMGLPVRNV